MNKRQLKAKLREIRDGRTMTEVAREVGVHKSMWSRAETHGIVGPGLKLALIRSLGIDLDAPTKPDSS